MAAYDWLVMRWLVNLAYALGAVLYLPVLIYQMIRQGKNRRGWRERFGHIARRQSDSPCVWIHAVSVGEMNATRQLTARWKDMDFVVSSTTDTGWSRGRQLYPDRQVFRYPLDFSWVVGRALDRIRPSLIVLMELEVWYNLVTMAARRGIPVVVVNGRLTERSLRRFSLVRPIVKRMFSSLSYVCAQDVTIGNRFAAAGVPADRIEVIGSLKWDTADTSGGVEGASALAGTMGIDCDRPLLVCGSTGPGEEEIMLDAYAKLREREPTLQLAIVPRKPERFDEVAALIQSRGLACVRRSHQPDGAAAQVAAANPQPVFLGDTMGELRKFYWLATCTFVGRSLVPMGGSDVMEVAALGKPIVVGPHTDNFAEPVAELLAADALTVVKSADGFVEAASNIVSQPDTADRMGQQARSVVIANQGATERTINALNRILGHTNR